MFFQYIDGPQEVKIADIGKIVEKDAKTEPIEPQPVEHSIW